MNLPFKIEFVSDGELFRNMTYSEWSIEWVRWLLSANPIFHRSRGEMLMTRGNISYKYGTDAAADAERSLTEPFFNKAITKKEIVFKGEHVFSDTPIYVIAIQAMYFVNEVDDFTGIAFDNVHQCREACRRDINAGGEYWFRISKNGKDYDLKDKLVLVETPSFNVTVSERSPLRERLEYPYQPGTYEAVSMCYCVIIKNLEAGAYRLQIGGIGRGTYMTDAVYDILVSDSKDPPKFANARPFSIPDHLDVLEPMK